MVSGRFGVMDGVDLIAEFGSDECAEEFRSDVLELRFAEGFRRSAYDDLQVCEVLEGYDQLHRVLVGLRRSRNQDLAVDRAFGRLFAAQRERAEVLRATA